MKYNWKVLALVGFLSGATTLAGYKFFIQDNSKEVILKDASEAPLARFTSGGIAGPVDFTTAAEVSTPMVVHIKSTSVRQQGGGRQQQGWPFDMFDFFGDGSGGYEQAPRRSEGTGSGVIITNDGYIVTNNHVVESAQEIEVTLHDKTKLKAKLVGTDPSTDIAVIKVESKNLPSITFGDSDGIRVGEWVVAVGNPFNLESTVTAGIVSAKGRGLGIIGSSQSRQRGRGAQGQGQQQFNDAIESFIQTDAVVNPGNSGGALVNLKGELVGINTAIASPTGSFAGYAFAVPSSIVKKVSTDLIKFGNAQRGYLGIVMQEVDNTVAEEKDLKVSSGILVRELAESSSAAGEAGIKPGDVIVKINGKKIGSTPELTQTVGLLRPGDKVNVTVNRDGKERDFNVTLKNREGGSGVIKREESALALESLGAQFTNLNDAEKKKLERYNIKGGVKITDVQGGKLGRVGIAPGFIITKVNGKPVTSVKELEKELAGKTDSMVQFEGLELDAPYDVYSFGFRL
ncbi:trypsin-like peptidase domain-containing protein [Ravibacter arvi]|uniref:Trypsin-like peptidase domain-containing protein n=1 Tax=Ravibacter arvi TaxID=2051041 RepID=A0ABP8LJE9_9BACT